MAGLIPITIPNTTPSGNHLKARMNHSCNKSVLEALVEIPHLPQFIFHPALLHKFLKTFQPHRIQESRGIADDQSAIEVVLRLCPITAFGNRLGAVGIELAPVQDAADVGMRFELLKSLMRIQPRVKIIEAHDEPN